MKLNVDSLYSVYVWVWSSIAMMEDGIFATDLPHIYRVHSSSGDVEYRLVDVASCLCSCPNNGLMCSHRYAVLTAMPKYALCFAMVILVRRHLSSSFDGCQVPLRVED